MANTPGFPSVATIVTFWKPASRASCAMRSAPAAEFKLSAAIDGSAIQSWSRFTASSWRAAISFFTSANSSAARAGLAPGIVVAIARATRVTALRTRTLRLVMGGSGCWVGECA